MTFQTACVSVTLSHFMMLQIVENRNSKATFRSVKLLDKTMVIDDKTLHFPNQQCLVSFLQNGTNVLKLIEALVESHYQTIDKSSSSFSSKWNGSVHNRDNQPMAIVFICVIFSLFTGVILLLLLKGSSEETAEDTKLEKFMENLKVEKRCFEEVHEKSQLIQAKRRAKWYSLKMKEAKKLKKLTRTLSKDKNYLRVFESVPNIVVSGPSPPSSATWLKPRWWWNDDIELIDSQDSDDTAGPSSLEYASSTNSLCSVFYEKEEDDQNNIQCQEIAARLARPRRTDSRKIDGIYGYQSVSLINFDHNKLQSYVTGSMIQLQQTST